MAGDSVFNLASVGKLFTALTLAHTADMSLTDNPDKYIAALTGSCIRSKTLGEIVSQSSGLPAYPDPLACPGTPHTGVYNYEDYIANLNCWGNPTCPASGYYLYSNDGFMLLRLVLAKHLKKSFPSLVAQFAKAVKMNQTSMIYKMSQMPALAVQGYNCYVPPEAEEGVESGCDGQPVSPTDELNNPRNGS